MGRTATKIAPWLPAAVMPAAAALLASCATPPAREPVAMPAQCAAPQHTAPIYVVRRRWHIDIGFPASALGPRVAALRDGSARYVLVGFGDRHYLLARGHRWSEMLGALLPGPGVILATDLSHSPEAVFGAAQVVELRLVTRRERSLERFIASSLAPSPSGAIEPLAPGPYGGSRYYASVQRYSALHTCNTWAAQALRAAGLPVRSAGVALAAQLWRQVRRLSDRMAVSCRPDRRRWSPSSSAARPPSCGSAAAGCCC